MPERYIAFDVETPNLRNDRISAIGITVVEDGEITNEFYSLIDPEVPFEPFNVELTGITPAMVAGKPSFAEIWPVIEPWLSRGVLLAHNASFDMKVLARCLKAYGIFWRPEVLCACTCQMGKQNVPESFNHKLNTLCHFFRIPLDHHNAGSDSRACAELLRRYMARGLDPAAFVRRYDLERMKTIKTKTH